MNPRSQPPLFLPGSRSSPLAAAVAAQPRARIVPCIDERSLAFWALGFGRACGCVVPLLVAMSLCTFVDTHREMHRKQSCLSFEDISALCAPQRDLTFTQQYVLPNIMCRRPAVVITSSGTAVANLLPAVVEASTAGVPLLLLTADRPAELRDTGANQTIDQARPQCPV